MAGTMVAVFVDHQAAVEAAKGLVEHGVVMNDISLVCKNAGGEHGESDLDVDRPDEEVQDEAFVTHGFREVAMHDVEQPLDVHEERAPRMVTGVVAGTSLGALLVATSVVIPGLGEAIAAGPLAAMMLGAVGGGVVGGIVGAMTAGGVPNEEAEHYHERVVAGDTLVAVLVGHNDIQKIEELLKSHGGQDVRYFTRFIDSLQSVES
jgi:hypothetical protein